MDKITNIFFLDKNHKLKNQMYIFRSILYQENQTL